MHVNWFDKVILFQNPFFSLGCVCFLKKKKKKFYFHRWPSCGISWSPWLVGEYKSTLAWVPKLHMANNGDDTSAKTTLILYLSILCKYLKIFHYPDHFSLGYVLNFPWTWAKFNSVITQLVDPCYPRLHISPFVGSRAFKPNWT